MRKNTTREKKRELDSQDWHFLQIPLPVVIYLFNYTEYQFYVTTVLWFQAFKGHLLPCTTFIVSSDILFTFGTLPLFKIDYVTLGVETETFRINFSGCVSRGEKGICFFANITAEGKKAYYSGIYPDSGKNGRIC